MGPIFYLITAVIFLSDQALKHLISATMTAGSTIKLVPGLLSITYIRNTGAAFGIFSNQTPVLSVISVGFIIMVIYYYVSIKNRTGGPHPSTGSGHSAAHPRAISLACLLGGALGNLSDRLFRGYVIDYIDVKYFSVFNLADVTINIGVGLLLIGFIIKYGEKK